MRFARLLSLALALVALVCVASANIDVLASMFPSTTVAAGSLYTATATLSLSGIDTSASCILADGAPTPAAIARGNTQTGLMNGAGISVNFNPAAGDDGKAVRILCTSNTNAFNFSPDSPNFVVLSNGASVLPVTTVKAGDTVTVTTSAITGSPTSASLVYSDGSPVAGATCNVGMSSCTFTAATTDDTKTFRITVTKSGVTYNSGALTGALTVLSTGASVLQAPTTVKHGDTVTVTTSAITGSPASASLQYAGGGAVAGATCNVATSSCTFTANGANDDTKTYRIAITKNGVTYNSGAATGALTVVFNGASVLQAPTTVLPGATVTVTTSGITGSPTSAALQYSDGTSVTGATCNVGMASCTFTAAISDDTKTFRITTTNGPATYTGSPVTGQLRVVSNGATTFTHTNPLAHGSTMTFETTAITGGANTITLRTVAPDAAIPATCMPTGPSTASCTVTADGQLHDNKQYRIAVASGAVNYVSSAPTSVQRVVQAAAPTPTGPRAFALPGGTLTLTALASGAGTITWQRRTGAAAFADYIVVGNCPQITAAGAQTVTCVVGNTAADDNYEYRVQSINAPVTVSSTPVLVRVVAITTQPVAKVAAENVAETVMFSVVATGLGSYEWQLSTDNGGTWAPATTANFPTITGETTNSIGFTPANDGTQNGYLFRVRIRNSQCAACGTGGNVDVTSNAVLLTVVAVTTDPVNKVVVSGNPTTPPYSFVGLAGTFQAQRWQQNCAYDPATAPVANLIGSPGWTDIPTETAATLTVATSNANGQAGTKNGCLYRVVITNTVATPNVHSPSEPGSLREVFYTMASTTLNHRIKYDYYATGSVLTAPFTEQQLPLAYSATNLRPISSRGVRSEQTCTLTLKYSAASTLGNAAVNTVTTTAAINALSQTFTLGTTTSPGAVAITAVPAIANTPNPTPNGLIGHTQARALNGGLLSLSCTVDGVTYPNSQTLTLFYPPLLSTAPSQRWSANPPNFATNGYVDFPEPGHWNYLDQQVARLEFLFDGNPTVIGVPATVTFNFKDAAGNVRPVAVGAPNTNVPKASVAAPALSAAVVVTNTVPVSSALTIAPLTITEARDNYHNKILSVSAVFPTPPTDPTPGAIALGTFAGFSQLVFQPTSYTLDAGALSPHYPPVLITVEPLTSEETNFPDTGVYRWPTRVLFHGFPKHDSQFGNAPYSSQPAPAVSVFPKRNYNQKLEYRSHDGTAYRTTLPLYRDTTTAMGQPSPTITLVASTNPNIPGVFEANSVIPPATVTPLRLYNKWVYRWVLGVYRVDGTYETYVEGRDLTTTPAYLSYYGISGGFLGIWNWYPREFVPALCPTVMGPYALGTTDQLVTPATLSATMYPRPAAGVLAWDYAHHTVNQWSLVDMTQPSTTLTGVNNGESPLLPAVPGVNHLFKSTFTVVESTIPSVLPTVGVPEIIGFEVKCEGRINTILSSDANSIITPKYTHTLPDLLGATKGQRTIRGFPNMVLTNNCKQVATLSTAAATPTPVTHRGGETLVFEFAAGTGTVNVQVKDGQDAAAPFVTAFSVTLNPAQTTTKQWTTRYKSDKTPVTVTSVQLNVAVTPAVKVHTHEYSNIPVNWPFSTANAVLPGAAANEAFTQCIAPQTVAANANANLAALTQQYHGCGTTSPTTAPSGNGC